MGEIFNIVSEETGQKVENPAAKVLREGRVEGLGNHTILISRGGERIPIDDSAAPIKDDRGNIIGVVLIFRDIIIRRNTEKVIQRLAAIVEGSDDAIIDKTLDGEIISWNPAAEKMYGYSEREAIGRNISIVVPPERLRELKEIMGKIRKGHRAQHFETLRKTKDGRSLDVSLTISPVTAPDGKVIGISTTARDISQRKRTEKELERIALEMQDLYEKAPCGYHSLDKDGFFVRVNDTELSWFGYSRGEMIGKKKLSDILTADSLKDFMKSFPVLKERGWIKNLEFDIIRKDGSILPVVLSATTVKDPSGSFMMTRSTIFDNTERKRIMKELVDLNNIKTEFVATVSHELRTPLTVIKEGASLISDHAYGDLNDEQAKIMGMVENNIKNLEKLISDLLDISRIESKKLEIKPVDFDICEAMGTLVKELETKAREKKVEIVMNCLFGGVKMVFADEDKFRQIITNLIANAINYNKESGKIFVTGTDEGEFLKIEVADTGVGIKEENIPKLFRRFTQFDRVPGSGPKGTGLGLAITKALVELHGGTIWAESKYGEGSKFTFTFPKHYNLLSKGNGTDE
jgi:PAS domain S-box-containing protein